MESTEAPGFEAEGKGAVEARQARDKRWRRGGGEVGAGEVEEAAADEHELQSAETARRCCHPW